MEPQTVNLSIIDPHSKLHQKLGNGGQADVYITSYQQHLCALKVYHPGPSKVKAYQQEAVLLSQLQHPHIVNLITHSPNAKIKVNNSSLQESRPMMVIEFAEGGDLFQYISKTGRLSAEVCRNYIKQLLITVSFLNKNNVAHRDIKPENILLDRNYRLKLADFGLACSLNSHQHQEFLTERVGTEGYRPPQMQDGKYTGLQADLFATGVTLFAMFTGSIPFKSTKSHDRHYRLIRQKNYSKFWQLHEKSKPAGFFPFSFKRLINSFFSADVSQRPSFQSLENDEWMNEQTATDSTVENYMSERWKGLYEGTQVGKIQKAVENFDCESPSCCSMEQAKQLSPWQKLRPSLDSLSGDKHSEQTN